MIRVVTLSEFEDDTLTLVIKRLQSTYGVGVEIGRRTSRPTEAYDPAEDAYDAVKTLTEAEDVRAFGDDKILFLTDRPLSLPVGPMGKGPIDGFADYDGVKAVATSAGVPKGMELPDALAKRAARHVGHLFGLHHCHDARCAMLPGWAEGFAHVGLNDLHLALGMDFMFEPLADGTVEAIGAKCLARGLPWGFGGVARPGRGLLPAEHVLAEHYRLGSSAAILSRSFCGANGNAGPGAFEKAFRDGVAEIRACEKRLTGESAEFFRANRDLVREKVLALKNAAAARKARAGGAP